MAYKFKKYFKGGTMEEGLFTYENYEVLLQVLEEEINSDKSIESIEITEDERIVITLIRNEEKEANKMETKEMPIIEVSKELKRELDDLDTIQEGARFYDGLELSDDLFEELCKIQQELDSTFITQGLMYLLATRNYVEKVNPVYHVLYGLISKKYYVWSIKDIPFDCNVFIKTFDNEKDAQRHADELNKFVEGK